MLECGGKGLTLVLMLRSNDHYYNALFQLPELLIAAILSTPTLLARISLVYPPPPEPSDLEASSCSVLSRFGSGF